ncbi:uncharacterized protein LOC124872670 isoform X3 [Girardinichthys multiradiatus]|uniref:uncharacterized protein LOC124872670 isoform X3 n=1 Tax=Girardinichthys multiradiatus TaxID=208333 RepID=UPI001FAB7B4A|nr:uncharacterized protein LOC124872670 isoform X3 [Girardinichthys multiradiatus]
MDKHKLTRWNSSLYMLQSLLEQKRALGVFVAECTLLAQLTATQWELMKKTADVLTPFEQLTRDVSRETTTAADVIPAMTGGRGPGNQDHEEDPPGGSGEATLLHCDSSRPQIQRWLLHKVSQPVTCKRTSHPGGGDKSRQCNARGAGAAAEPENKARRSEACSSLDRTFEEI